MGTATIERLAPTPASKRHKPDAGVTLLVQGKNWSAFEINRLLEGLESRVSFNTKHPKHVIINGEHSEDVVLKVLGEEISGLKVTYITDMTSNKLPFLPLFREQQ